MNRNLNGFLFFYFNFVIFLAYRVIMATEIRFYDKKDAYYELSNFWGSHIDKRFKLRIDDRNWISTEHYYQSHKLRGHSVRQLCLYIHC